MTQHQHQPAQRTSLQYVKGIGPKRSAALESIGITSTTDLLHYFPRGYLDRSTIAPISGLRSLVAKREEVTVIGEVFRQEARRSKRSNRIIFFLTIKDETGFVQCVWFEGIRWVKDAFEIGEMLAVSAIPTLDKLGRAQFVHPEFDRLRGALEEDEPDWGKMINTGAIIPKYSSTSDLGKVGLDSRGFRRILRTVVSHHATDVADPVPESVRTSQRLPDLQKAIKAVHFPADFSDLTNARKRLKFDELFFWELLMALRRNSNREAKGISFEVESKLARALVDSLPFGLTSAQKKVTREIAGDMAASRPMNRLLQGDVGSGKTIVALMAMLVAVDNGYQVAFMAPTEILAEQHLRTLTSFLTGLPVNVRLLIGGQRKKLREDVLEDIRSGRAHIIVGTHALIEENVRFANLGFVVIDEQHRFGVVQRAELKGKGTNPDVLVMTATPIPRTLAMTVFGDLDVSTIDEMPANRKAVRTAIRMEEQKEKVYSFVRQEVQQGRQVYVVFPLVEDSEKVDLKAATTEFERLKKDVFSDLSLGLLHGKMKSEEKEEIMRQFKDGAIQVMVATTVIEVGIDVPNASVMVIENAERFGLSQLHQLRGRVGRGADQSYCILIANYGWFDRGRRNDPFDTQLEKDRAKTRLDTMVETTDGFRIAEVDLRLRGPGEILGTRQSGMPEFKIANLLEDGDILRAARDEAFALVNDDPHLRKADHAKLLDHFLEYYGESWGQSAAG